MVQGRFVIKISQQSFHGLRAQFSLKPGRIPGWWRRQGVRHTGEIEWIKHIFALGASGICGRATALAQPGSTIQSQSVIGNTTHRSTLLISYISPESSGRDSKFLCNFGCTVAAESHLHRSSHRRQVGLNVPFYFSSFRLGRVGWGGVNGVA